VSRAVILHRYEDTAAGVPRIVESGAFDPDAEDNPEWVTEALANREEPQEAEPRLTEWEDALSEPQPASVLDTVEFGEDTSLPEGVDEPVEVWEDSEVIDPEPAGVISRTEFGVETPVLYDDQPPKSGPGSGKAVWAAYAEGQGVEVTDDMTRDDIIAACEDVDSSEE
jgi:hypothetical protein